MNDTKPKLNFGNKSSSPLAGEDEFQHELESVRNSGEGYKTSHRYYSPYIKDFSRALRKDSTTQERKMWSILKNNKLGFKFRRQFNVDNKYIADFICLKKRLIIEIDGGQHNEPFYDATRTFYLENHSFIIIRFWNNEVDNNFDGCIELLLKELDTPHPCCTPHPSPLPQGARENTQLINKVKI